MGCKPCFLFVGVLSLFVGYNDHDRSSNPGLSVGSPRVTGCSAVDVHFMDNDGWVRH